jgi:hypothetical protein
VSDEFSNQTVARLRSVLADAQRDLASIEESTVLPDDQIARGRAAFLELIDAVRGVLHNLQRSSDSPS